MTPEQLKIVMSTLKKTRGRADISDEDLKLTIRLLTPLVELSTALGTEYRLFQRDLTEKLSKLIDFRQARIPVGSTAARKQGSESDS